MRVGGLEIRVVLGNNVYTEILFWLNQLVILSVPEGGVTHWIAVPRRSMPLNQVIWRLAN